MGYEGAEPRNVADIAMDIATTSLSSDLRECAILLDIDGTILDIAPTPREVWVPPELRHTLARLQGPDRRCTRIGKRPPGSTILT